MMNYKVKNILLLSLFCCFFFAACTNVEVGQVELKGSKVSTKVNINTLDEAWLTLEIQFHNHLDHSVKGKLICYLDSLSFSMPVSLKAAETKNVVITPEEAEELYIKNPRLWWCTNLGKPELYHLKSEFVVSGETIDTEELDFGIREISDCVHRGKERFSLNGKKINARGINWINLVSANSFLNSNELEIRYLRDMNINSISFDDLNAVPQEISTLCDKYGLLMLSSNQCMRDTLKMSRDSIMDVRLAFEQARMRVSNLVYPFVQGVLYTDSLITTPAYYEVRRTNRTQQLLYSYKKNAVYFVNDNVIGPVEKKARIAMYDLDSSLLHEATIDFRVESDWSKKIFELDEIAGNAFLFLQLLDNKGNEETRNLYCLSANNDMKAFSGLPKTELLIDYSTNMLGESMKLEVDIMNEGKEISLMTYFTVKDENDNVIYPIFWDDNYLNILPQEKKKVACTLQISDIVNKKLKLHVSGSNIKSRELSLPVTW